MFKAILISSIFLSGCAKHPYKPKPALNEWRGCQATITAHADGYEQHAICTKVDGKQFDVAVRKHKD